MHKKSFAIQLKGKPTLKKKNQTKVDSTFSSKHTLFHKPESGLLITTSKLKLVSFEVTIAFIFLQEDKLFILLKVKYLNFSRQVSTSPTLN